MNCCFRQVTGDLPMSQDVGQQMLCEDITARTESFTSQDQNHIPARMFSK